MTLASGLMVTDIFEVGIEQSHGGFEELMIADMAPGVYDPLILVRCLDLFQWKIRLKNWGRPVIPTKSTMRSNVIPNAGFSARFF